MAKTLFFYDLETSGLSARDDRIMQFAGQRTDMNCNPIGEPVNELIQMSNDVLPSPEALLITGISPQETVENGFSEAVFAAKLSKEVFTPDTIVVGFNNIRFDDEFIRHLFWRNFIDPYEWTWKDGRSRWDILDVVRMTRALRPDGITWPVDEKGNATNRLELLTKANNLIHSRAHDALSDVEATIAVAKLLQEKQPQLFQYLLSIRQKRDVQKLVNLDERTPFVYTSGRYDTEHHKTTVAFPLTSGKNNNVVVYDLRYDPTPVVGCSSKELSSRIFATYQEKQADGFLPVAVKELQYNRAPAVAPMGVLEAGNGWERIGLEKSIIEKHRNILLQNPEFAENVRTIYEDRPEFPASPAVEGQLYNGFIDGRDKVRIEKVRELSAEGLADFHPQFDDERLPELLLHYKARNYPTSLSGEEEGAWHAWRAAAVEAKLPSFMQSLSRVAARKLSESEEFIVQQLQLWAENIMPTDDYSS